ncbi:M14 family zinc carboxypeptidase [Streptomyces sp. NPDC058000]|uniref:M14 family zinc carboxypeptidase n=1 Tax=Streptomyces sp. NPDC058000 TaxID=3346299 RepID=UPI0036F0CDD0
MSPSFDNSCANHGTASQSGGRTRHGSGTAGGLLTALPVATPLNQCGGTDLPLVNPDGFQYAWTTNRLWQKSRTT